jgi:hypothetical protein
MSNSNNNRLVLLLGAARSGTTWLASILNSHPAAVYCHEPLIKFPTRELEPLLAKARDEGRLTTEERERVLWHWSRAYPGLIRPPFFQKDFLRTPSAAVWSAWLAVGALGHGHAAFRRAFSPGKRAHFDLVVKQGGITTRVSEYVRALRPDHSIVLLRHPGAVVSSVLRGQRMGVMESESREYWLGGHSLALASFGWDRDRVLGMSECEFLALDWLIENSGYLALCDEHPNVQLVIYRDLVADPMAVTRSVFGKLGWSVSRQTEKFLAATIAARPPRFARIFSAKNSYYSIYKGGSSSLDGWRTELADDQQQQISAITKPLLDRYWPVPDPALVDFKRCNHPERRPIGRSV